MDWKRIGKKISAVLFDARRVNACCKEEENVDKQLMSFRKRAFYSRGGRQAGGSEILTECTSCAAGTYSKAVPEKPTRHDHGDFRPSIVEGNNK